MSAGRKFEAVGYSRKLDSWTRVMNPTEAQKPTTESVLAKAR